MELHVLRDPDGEDVRVALTAAVREHGLDSPSLRELARLSHRSPSTLSARFGSKSGLHRRALGTLAVRWNRALEDHPIVDERHADLARLRLAFEELARNDAGVAHDLHEVVAMEKDHIDGWLQRYAPQPSIRQGPLLSAGPAIVLELLQAAAIDLWDAGRHPDRAAARARFEDLAEVALLGAERLSALRGRWTAPERSSGDPRPASGAEHVSGDPRPASGAEHMAGLQATHLRAEHSSDASDAGPETGRTFEEATRPPYTIIRP